jgi:chemotaxis protein MotB
MDEAKVMRVLGLASTQNLNKKDPLDPENRRISVIVLNRKTEMSMLRDDGSPGATLDNGTDAQGAPTTALGQLIPGIAARPAAQ